MVQRIDMSTFTKRQKNRAEDIKSGRGAGRFTTVGLEWDLANLAAHTAETPNILQGISHLEFARSAKDFNGLRMILETDANNVLEFVTPPFFVLTRAPGVAAPQPHALIDMIDMMKQHLNSFVRARMTLGDLINAGGWGAFGLGALTLDEGLSAKVDWRNWSWRAQPGAAVKAGLDDEEVLKNIALETVIVAEPQINIATSADFYGQVATAKDVGSRLEKSGGVISDKLDALQKNISNYVMNQHNIKGKLLADGTGSRIGAFLERMTEVLAYEVASPAVRQLAEQQKLGWKGERTSSVKELGFLADDASFVKDWHGAWLKTDLVSYAIGILEEGDWAMLDKVLDGVRENVEQKLPIGKKVTKDAVPLRAALIGNVTKMQAAAKGLVAASVGNTYDSEALAILDRLAAAHPALHEISPAIVGVRQDTFINPRRLRDLTQELGFTKALHVMEIRNPSAFLDWLKKQK
ncbi:MAG: hypothetical protein ACRDQU_16295 [Pseudonocardiaceae bacterium]